VAGWSARPFDGRIHALAGYGDGLLVAGADLEPFDPAGAGSVLGSRALVRLDRDGKVVDREELNLGPVVGLAAGTGWFAAVDDDGRVDVWGGTRSGTLPWGTGVSAIGGAGDELIVVGAEEVELWDTTSDSDWPGGFERTTGAIVRAIVRAGDAVIGLTTDGLLTWPDERLEPGHPIAIASGGDTYFVLQPDWSVEQRHPDGTLVHRATLAGR
jgi:hypothetical protein